MTRDPEWDWVTASDLTPVYDALLEEFRRSAVQRHRRLLKTEAPHTISDRAVDDLMTHASARLRSLRVRPRD